MLREKHTPASPFTIMVDRSESLHDVSIPPFAPRAPPIQPSSSTTDLLESLVAFYQQEMVWVYRIRATLAMSDSSTSVTPLTSASSHTPVTEEELANTPLETSTTRWSQRKPSLRLNLDGSVVSTIGGDQFTESGEHVLVLFERMMEARMESCLRMNRLVRKANRADLHVR